MASTKVAVTVSRCSTGILNLIETGGSTTKAAAAVVATDNTGKAVPVTDLIQQGKRPDEPKDACTAAAFTASKSKKSIRLIADLSDIVPLHG
jgi:hypothetical protein